MKKIMLCVAVLASFMFANEYDFRMGFEAGLKATDFQRKNEGIQPRKVYINKPYIVILDTENIAISEVLFLQQVAYKDGYQTYLTENSLFFGGFDRKADAQNAMRLINKEYNIKSVVKSVSKGYELVTYPNLWQEATINILNLAKQQGYLLKTEIVEKDKIVIKEIIKKQPIIKKVQPVVTKPKVEIKPPVKIMNLKNQKAMSYILEGNNSNSSINFKEYQFLSGSYDIESETPIKTYQGEVFYKVKGENLYFNALDVGEIK